MHAQSQPDLTFCRKGALYSRQVWRYGCHIIVAWPLYITTVEVVHQLGGNAIVRAPDYRLGTHIVVAGNPLQVRRHGLIIASVQPRFTAIHEAGKRGLGDGVIQFWLTSRSGLRATYVPHAASHGSKSRRLAISRHD